MCQICELFSDGKLARLFPLTTLSCQKISSTIQISSHFNEYFLFSYLCVCVCMKSLCVIHESSEWNNFMVNYIRLPLACSTRKCSLFSIHAILMMNPMSHWFLMTISQERNLEQIFRTCMMPLWGSNKIKIMFGL